MASSESTSRLNDWLEACDAEELRALLAEAMDRMPELHDWLDAQRAAAADDPAELLGVVDAALKPTQRFYDYRQANRYADETRDVVDLIAARAHHATADLVPVIERAITLTTRAILKSDDSSGLQGDQVRTLLDAHAEAVCMSSPVLTQAQQTRLVKWMVKYRYSGKQDFFDPDIVAYAPGLSDKSIASYRTAIKDIDLGPYGRYPLSRLAVLDRDRDAILEANGGEPWNALVAERLVDDLIEAGLRSDAVHYAQVGMALDGRGWKQKLVDLVVEDAVDSDDRERAIELRREWFARFPMTSSFSRLKATAEQLGIWEQRRAEAESQLAERNPDAFAEYLLDEDRVDESWYFATKHIDPTRNAILWLNLCQQRARTHPADTIPLSQTIILETLKTTDKRNYRAAAKQLKSLRAVAKEAGSGHESEFSEFLEQVVEQNRRRPTCLDIFARAGLINTR